MDYLFPTNASDDLSLGKPDLMIQVGHRDKLQAVAFSPDGKQLLTGSIDHAARLWDIKTGREIRCFHGHTKSITAVAFSPDGQQLITGSKDDTVRVWNPRTGQQTGLFKWEGVEYLAYSFDGGSVLSRESRHIQAILWNLVENTQLYLDKQGTHHSCTAYSPTRHEIVTGNHDGGALWDTEGTRLQDFPGPAYKTAFSTDGNLIAFVGEMFTPITVWTRDGKKQGSFMTPNTSYNHVFFLPGGAELLAITTENAVERWNLEALDQPVHNITGTGSAMLAPVAISPDYKYLVRCASSATLFEMIDLANGERIQQFEGEGKSIWQALFSPSGNRLAVKNSGQHYGRALFTAVWDLSTGRETFRTTEEPVAFSQDGALLFVTDNGHTRIVTTDAGTVVRELEGSCLAVDTEQERVLTNKGLFDVEGTAVRTYLFDTSNTPPIQAISPDLRLILYGHNRFIWLWDTVSGTRRWEYNPPRRSTESDLFFGDPDSASINVGYSRPSPPNNPNAVKARFTPDGQHLIVAGLVGGIRRFEVATGAQEIVAMAAKTYTLDDNPDLKDKWVLSEREDPIEAMALMPDPTQLLVAQQHMVSLWALNNQQLIAPFPGHTSTINTLLPVPGKNWILTGGQNTAQLVDLQTGQALVQLSSFEDGTWVVIDSAGRFDTNNLEEIKGMHWVMPDAPMQPLPLEIFMRTYFEPRLLTRIMKGENFQPVPDISQINRLQPGVRIEAITPHFDNPADPHVALSITVESIQHTVENTHGEPTRQESEAWDLHVFRDGQLVTRIAGTLLEPAERHKTFQIDPINIPRTGADQVVFSAYAFNKDRVKSQTTQLTYPLPPDIIPQKGRAYLISIGVNVYEDPQWNLNFAVNDARDMQSSLTMHLSARDQYDVIPIQLIADEHSSTATRAHFNAVIDQLAGREAKHPQALREIPDYERLSEARPEDLILFSFAGHGFTGDGTLGDQGAFYFLFSDIGPDATPITAEVLDRTLSSESLTQWLTEVDAGDMIFIIDACHSAASVEGAGFKPGPMGSRGLGQMAYNKGMLIMAASAADDVALESESLEQGLLTYVLIEEGLNKQKADFGSANFNQEDAVIKLQEWLQYGAARVPELARAIAEGKHRGFSLTRGPRGERVDVKPDEVTYQQPAVFNYRKRASDIVLWAREEEG